MGLFDKPVRGLFLLPKTEPSTIARNLKMPKTKGFQPKTNERIADNTTENDRALRTEKREKSDGESGGRGL